MVWDKLCWTLLLYLRSVMYFYGNIVGTKVTMVHFVKVNEWLFNLPPSYLSAREVFPVLLRGIGNGVLNCSCNLHWESAGLKICQKTLLHLSQQHHTPETATNLNSCAFTTRHRWAEVRHAWTERDRRTDGFRVMDVKASNRKDKSCFPHPFILYPSNLHRPSLSPNCPPILRMAFYVTHNNNAFHSSHTNTDAQP